MLSDRAAELNGRAAQLSQAESHVNQRQTTVAAREAELAAKEAQLIEQDQELTRRQQELVQLEANFNLQREQLEEREAEVQVCVKHRLAGDMFLLMIVPLCIVLDRAESLLCIISGVC